VQRFVQAFESTWRLGLYMLYTHGRIADTKSEMLFVVAII
jgi:hypothetical protein